MKDREGIRYQFKPNAQHSRIRPLPWGWIIVIFPVWCCLKHSLEAAAFFKCNSPRCHLIWLLVVVMILNSLKSRARRGHFSAFGRVTNGSSISPSTCCPLVWYQRHTNPVSASPYHWKHRLLETMEEASPQMLWHSTPSAWFMSCLCLRVKQQQYIK